MAPDADPASGVMVGRESLVVCRERLLHVVGWRLSVAGARQASPLLRHPQWLDPCHLPLQRLRCIPEINGSLGVQPELRRIAEEA